MNTKKTIRVIATHTAGQPTRTVVSGFLHIPGNTMQEKYLYMQEHADWLRTMVCQEPRGSDIMSGALITAPCSSEADFGVLHFEAAGWLPMCGHNTIGVCTAIAEEGLIDTQEPVTKLTLETPLGLVRASIDVENGSATNVRFLGAPSFALVQDAVVKTQRWGDVPVDISWGGSAVAFIPADFFGHAPCVENATFFANTAVELRAQINEQLPICDARLPGITGVSHVAFYQDGEPMRHVVVGPDGQCDRSPCGNGTCARAGLLHAQGRLKIHEQFQQRSVIDSAFTCRCAEELVIDGMPAIIPEISGRAWVTAFSSYVMDESDPFGQGFSLTL